MLITVSKEMPNSSSAFYAGLVASLGAATVRGGGHYDGGSEGACRIFYAFVVGGYDAMVETARGAFPHMSYHRLAEYVDQRFALETARSVAGGYHCKKSVHRSTVLFDSF